MRAQNNLLCGSSLIPITVMLLCQQDLRVQAVWNWICPSKEGLGCVCVRAVCRQCWCWALLVHTAECTRGSTPSVGTDAAERHLLRTGLRSSNLSISIAEQMVSHHPCYFSFSWRDVSWQLFFFFSAWGQQIFRSQNIIIIPLISREPLRFGCLILST